MYPPRRAPGGADLTGRAAGVAPLESVADGRHHPEEAPAASLLHLEEGLQPG